MGTQVEGTLRLSDGTSLYTKTWLPDSKPLANLVFFHGFSDHINRYYSFFPTLASRGIATYGIDQRGWGRSVQNKAQRGLTGPTTTVLSDLAAFIKDVLSQAAAKGQEDVPLFIMGHSMGGNEVLTLASSREYEDSVISKTRGWLLESPFIGFAKEEQPPWLKVAVGKMASKVLPRFQLANPIPPERLTRDKEVQKSLAEDELLHQTGTLEGLAGLIARVEDLRSGKAVLSRRVRSLWLGHGDHDMTTSYEASRTWFERQTGVEDRTFKTYVDGMHVLHGDSGKEEFYGDVGDWILARCGGGGIKGAVVNGEEVKGIGAKEEESAALAEDPAKSESKL